MEPLKEYHKEDFEFYEKSDDETDSSLHLSFQSPVPQQGYALHIVIEYPEYD